MSKYLGIDYGDQRIGLAISDEDGEFAVPLEIITNEGREKTIAKIDALAKEEKIKIIVVGLPLPLSPNQPVNEEQRRKTERFIAALKALPYQVATEDERLTSKLAERLTLRKSAGQDDVAAMLILQTYLDRTSLAS